MKIELPELSLVLLVGASASGKSTFAARHFLPSEVLSSDEFRLMVSDDVNDQSATRDAFDVLHYVAAKRLAAGRLTVVDATNVQLMARQPLVALARAHHVLPVALVFDLPERVCLDRNAARSDRNLPARVLHRHRSDLKRSLPHLSREGFRHVHVFHSPEQVDAAVVERVPLWNDRKTDHGPFDIVGDVHGCFDELLALLVALGYEVDLDAPAARHPEGRRVIFLGDLVDRGPKVADTLRLAMAMVAGGQALAIPGNHDDKLLRKLRGRNVQLTHGLAETLAELDATSPEFRDEVARFLDSLVSHYLLDEGRLVVAHAGLSEALQGRASGAVRSFALFGDTTGETDELGLPVRRDWAAEYRGRAAVVYGHTPVAEPEWVNGTMNIDTGCVFGGALTALRWPERTLVAVPAARAYAESPRPLAPAPSLLTRQQLADDLLDLGDYLGKLRVDTKLAGTVTVHEQNTAAALEVMGRFAVDPKWLIYLPPTMSPAETSAVPEVLEHPAEAFAYYRAKGLREVVCEEKHMGSRVVLLLCRDADVARRRFGVLGAGRGSCYTRTGRPFFTEGTDEAQLLARLGQAVDAAGLWEELATDWLCLDAELMPWSAKAQGLLRRQYAAVGAAGTVALGEATTTLARTVARGLDLADLAARVDKRSDAVARYVEAYGRYCWPVDSVDDLRLAPFHLLASEGHVHTDRDHVWHMETLARLAAGDPLFVATPFRLVDLDDPASEAEAVAWWTTLVAAGGEGMVVKPRAFLAWQGERLVQPALKVRGPEYLRIIYGPEYSLPENLERLRGRNLGPKRNLARRELALGLEALQRFVAREPLRRVHECVFAVLALESEPVDPRL